MAQTGPPLDRSLSTQPVFGRDLQRQRSDKWLFRAPPFSATASLSKSGIKISMCRENLTRFKSFLPSAHQAQHGELQLSAKPQPRAASPFTSGSPRGPAAGQQHHLPEQHACPPQQVSPEAPRSLRKDDGGLNQLICCSGPNPN